jgi:hypothetical protein
MKSKKIEFLLPSEFVLPDGVDAGDEFEALATLQLKENGRACLVALDGNRVEGYREDDEKPDKRSYSQAASDAMDEEMEGMM